MIGIKQFLALNKAFHGVFAVFPFACTQWGCFFYFLLLGCCFFLHYPFISHTSQPVCVYMLVRYVRYFAVFFSGCLLLSYIGEDLFAFPGH